MKIIITPEQKQEIKKAIRGDGYMISGWAMARGHDSDTFYHVLDNTRGHGKKPSPKCDAIIKDLVGCGYLVLTKEQQEIFKQAA